MPAIPIDARWLVPHFEKMLYDNALLIDLLTAAWQETHNSRFMPSASPRPSTGSAREMRLADGGFASSLDADSEHEEGKFYVWSEAEIDAAARRHARRASRQIYDVSAAGNWEGHTILNRLDHLDAGRRPRPRPSSPLTAPRCSRSASARIRPGLDDKVLADWNGLMIAALANAALVFERPDWLDLAADAFAFVAGAIGTMRDGRLLHSWRGRRAQHHAILDDYANMSRAALALFEATGDDRLSHGAPSAGSRRRPALRRCAAAAYFFTADDAEASDRPRQERAGSVPTRPATASMAGVLARLYYLTGEDHYRARAKPRSMLSPASAAAIFGHATLLNAAELLQRGLQIVIDRLSRRR